MPPNTLYVSEIANSNVCRWSGKDTKWRTCSSPANNYLMLSDSDR